jgi:hypothetical protein
MAENPDRARREAGKATWMKIFTAFRLAIDMKKLLLAAAGILVAYLGWWVLSFAFYKTTGIPEVSGFINEEKEAAKDAYLDSALRWSLLHELAGDPRTDLSALRKQWESEGNKLEGGPRKAKIDQLVTSLKQVPGRLRGCPWDEYRGPNQFLFVSQLIQQGASGSTGRVNSHAAKSYLLYMIEPLCKFLLPVTYFFDSRAGGFISWNRIYLLLVLLWTVATWGFFGGAISRMATVQLARNEKVGMMESLHFVGARWQGYVFAPIMPVIALLIMGLVLWFFGLVIGWTFVLGDLIGGLLWPLALLLGLVMTVILVGLIGWPLMNATISTEGSDSFDALSRSYSYVYQVPWHYLGYSLAALAYGAVLVFFVGFMGTLLVYLGGWGINQAPIPTESRDPAYLFQYAPGSFEWRDVLLKDSPNVEVEKDQYGAKHYRWKKIDTSWYVQSGIGMGLVTLWLGIFFLLVLGFGYSYFWTAATIIYLLLRQKVDDTDFDEVYLEEDPDEPFVPEPPPSPAHAPSPGVPGPNSGPPGVTFTMVDAPAIRPNEPPAPIIPDPTTPAAPTGNSPPESL